MATRAKYNRVKQENPKEEKPDTDILMRFSTTYGRYISRGLTLLFGEDRPFVTIKAADRLMDRALWVAEVLRRKVQGLHQVIEIKEREVVDVYEPKEEGLLRVEQKRFLTIIEITLTRQPTADQKNSVGYQAPPTASGQEDYLTKEKWQQQEAERKEKFANRPERREEGGDRRDNRRDDRRDNRRNDREERGGEREGRGEQRNRGRRN